MPLKPNTNLKLDLINNIVYQQIEINNKIERRNPKQNKIFATNDNYNLHHHYVVRAWTYACIFITLQIF